MNPDRWKKINELFVAASAEPAERRSAFLAAACGSDTALRDEVESLLSYDGHANGFLRSPDPIASHRLFSNSRIDTPAEEQRVGPYQLVSQLGSGGMGTVWLARRADAQFNKQVAIKLIKRGMDTKRILERFRVERQVLAGLEHPNIARMIDGGVTSDGRPYMVMEYVEGLSIDRYCDEKRLTIAARLDLFCRVCAAVQYAHQKLVVHRDLKPGNILVTPGGEVKLLDFGIAKVLAGGETGSSISITLEGPHPMTPRYASPEQVRGEPISTATDIYSLGAVLYELLTGRASCNPTDNSLRAIERAICEQPPSRPSEAVLQETSGDMASARSTDARRLRRLLIGDLDTIVLTALNKEPGRRYSSVEQFSGDISRHLAGLPVTARPDTLGYRTRKFIRRNPLPVALAATVFLLVLGAAIGFAILSRKLAGERNIAMSARAEATEKLQQSNQMSSFLKEILVSANPESVSRSDMMVREALDRAADRIGDSFVDRPEQEAWFRGILSRSYAGLGLYEKAEAHGRESLRLYESLSPARAQEVAQACEQLSSVLRKRGEYAQAAEYAKKSLALQVQLHGDKSPAVANSLMSLAGTLGTTAKPDEAESLMRQALHIYRSQPGTLSGEFASCLMGVAEIHARRGEIEEAMRLNNEAIEVSKKVYGEVHAFTAGALNYLAETQQMAGDLAAAEQSLTRSLEILTKIHDSDHGNVGYAHGQLATVQLSSGQYAKAEASMRASLDCLRKVLGEAHDDVLTTSVGLAEILRFRARENLPEAETLCRNAIPLLRREFGTDSEKVAHAMSKLRDILIDQGQFEEAETLAREVLKIEQKLSPSLLNFNRAYAHWGLGDVFFNAGRTDDARKSFEEALAIIRQLVGEAPDPDIAVVETRLADCNFELGRRENAEAQYRSAIARFEAIQSVSLPEAASARMGLIELTLRADNARESESSLRDILQKCQAAGEVHRRVLGRAESALGRCLMVLAKQDDAEKHLLSAYRHMTDSHGPSHWQTARVAARLADLYADLENNIEADRWKSAANQAYSGADTSGISSLK